MVLCVLMLLSLNNPRSLLLFLMFFFYLLCSTFILCAICGSGETVRIVVLVAYIVALVRPFSYQVNKSHILLTLKKNRIQI